MEDTLSPEFRKKVLGLASLLSDHKGMDAVAMDLSGLNAWTDYFVIATVTSSTHRTGLLKQIKEYAAAEGLEILRSHRRAPSDDEWSLVDLGSIVVHLMSAKSRDFYELERLWSGAAVLTK